MGIRMNANGTFHETLVKLFNEILELEHKAIITEEFKDISNNDMNIIATIGNADAKNMSMVARGLKITVGTLTIAINNLVKKGYVRRVRSEEDRRVVLLSLSQKGRKAYIHQARFRKNMVEAALEGMNQEETMILVRAMTNLSNYFKNVK